MSKTKKCPRCELTKPVAEFFRRSVKSKKLNSYCKPCGRAYKNEWYQSNKTGAIKQRQRSKEAKRRLREEVNVLKSEPCTDCGYSYNWWQMHYDHINDDKVMRISQLVIRGNRKKLFEEIEKCGLVCANCHADRTYRRANGQSI